MTEAHDASRAAEPADAGPNLSLISTQLSWMRSDLSTLRTLLAWARTSVSMIGFGFTISNFYDPEGFKRPWIYIYVLAGVIILIELITLRFMLRVV